MSGTNGYSLGAPTGANGTAGSGNGLAPESREHKALEQAVIGQELARQGVLQEPGVAVHTFDPDASPAQKAAAAGAGRVSLMPSITNLRGNVGAAGAAAALASTPGGLGDAARAMRSFAQPGASAAEAMPDGGRGIVMDLGSAGSAHAPVPTVSIRDLDAASRAEGQGKGGEKTTPAAITSAAGATLPDSSTVGWQQVVQKRLTALRDPDGDASSLAPGKQTLNTMLAEYVDPEFYGTPIHNGAIVIFAVLATRTLTLFGLGWAWCLVVLAFCTAMYSLSIERTRKRAREEIERELTKTRLVTETETADWINSLLDRAWLIAEPLLSATIVASVDSALAGQTPPGIDSIRMTTFTLGNRAPRIHSIRTYPNTPDDEIIMEWALGFTPNDIEDITPKQAAHRVNPKIVLNIRLGKGFVGVGMPILLEDISFVGHLRIKAKLMSNFPHCKNVQISFLEKPDFDYVLKPLGGETFGMDINSIPGLASFVKDQVHANLGPMMYSPNYFNIDLEQLLSGTPLDSAIGVLKVTIESARGLKAVKLGGGAPDPYVSLSLGAKAPVARTKTITSNANPTWNESQFLLINTLTDVLHLSLFDYNDVRGDNLLGSIAHEMQGLGEDAEQEGIVAKVISGGKDRGELRYSLSYYPVLSGLKAPDSTPIPPPESSTGIVRLTIHQAKDLDSAKTGGTLHPYAKVYLGAHQQIHRTPTMKSANAPVWESATEYLVADKSQSTVTIRVVDGRDGSRDPDLGTITVKLLDLLEAKERQQDWFPLSRARSGKIRLTVDWKPLALAGALDGAAAYVPPIGIMRIHLKKAIDLKNVEAALGGKSDPFVRVLLNNHQLARTDHISNNLNPEWDAFVYIPVHTPRERLLLEAMDFQNVGKDRSLGTVELAVRDFFTQEGTARTPFTGTGAQERQDRIRLDGKDTYKGTLVYSAEFFPAVSLRGGVSFKPAENELAAAAKQIQAQGDGTTTPSTATATGTQTPALDPSESRGGGEATPAEKVDEGIVMTTQEILSSQSGVLVVQVLSGQLSKRGRLELLLDENYWPSFVTTKARSHKQTWDSVHEAFVRELDFSRTTLRLNQDDNGEQDDIIAEFTCQTRELLEACLEHPATFTLSSPSGGDRCSITLNARFVPVDITLTPRESINNMGTLRVDLIDAKDLAAADRSGKSDPYAVFSLNGSKAYKSEPKKKTLTPVWNENFSCQIPSRVAAKFDVEVFDWNQLQQAESLGRGTIDLSAMEPFQATEEHIALTSSKHGRKGTVHIRMVFQPEVIMKTRKNTSTFSNAGRAMTTVAGAPIAVGKGVGKGVVHGGMGVVHGVGHVGGFAGRLVKKGHGRNGSDVVVEEGLPIAPPLADGVEAVDYANGDVSHAQDAGMVSALREGAAASQVEGGTLLVTCVTAKDLPSGDIKPYLQLRLGSKTHKTGHAHKGSAPEWNETLKFSIASGESSDLGLKLLDHKTLGKDKELGEASVEIRRFLQPWAAANEQWVPLEGGHGNVLLRFEYQVGAANGHGRHRTPSIHSKVGSTTDSPSKFSMTRQK